MITPRLSICIPTRNRPHLLMRSLRSIPISLLSMGKIEVCISDNNTSSSIPELKDYIQLYGLERAIQYKKHINDISIDENMHYAVEMANGDYLFYLGDDDYFDSCEVHKLLDLIQEQEPDLVIFNGNLVDKNEQLIGKLFPSRFEKSYTIQEAYLSLKNKSMFGSIMVRRSLINSSLFRRLYGTSHAYGCFWFTLLDRANNLQVANIIVPSFYPVFLQMADKTYSIISAYYRDSPYELSVYQRFLGEGPSQIIHYQYSSRYHKMISSTKFLLRIRAYGCDLDDIKYNNPAIYYENNLKITFSQAIGCTIAFQISAFFYNFLKKWFIFK
jgi:abequosyltransferase